MFAILVSILCVGALLFFCVGTALSIFSALGPERLSPSNTLSSISMVSATEGWAVGQYTDDEGNRQGRMYHYQAGVWKRQAVPAGSGFTSIWMVSAHDGWAVGSAALNEGSAGQIYHYQDGVWEQYALFGDTSTLFNIWMISPTEGWAVGGQGLILHYQASAWTPVNSPTTDDLVSVSFVSPTEGWAVGFDTILHYQNGVWSEAADPMPRDELESVRMILPTVGWIVGLKGATLQYTDGQWVQVSSDTSAAQFGALFGLALVSASEGWAVGDGAIFHYLDGSWQTALKLGAQVTLTSIVMLSAEEGWAVGYSETSAETAVLMHYSQGTWKQEQVSALSG